MYMSYLLSIVEYASVVWDECSEQYLLTLHNVQNEAAVLVTGLTRSVSLEKTLQRVWMGNSITKIQQHKLFFMYNVNTGMVPSCIHNFNPSLSKRKFKLPFKN